MRRDSSTPIPAIGSSSSSRRGRSGEGHRDLELALLAVRQIGREDVAARRQTHLLEDAARWGGEGRVAARVAPEAEAVARARLHRKRHVFERGEFGIDARNLEGARQPAARPLGRRQAGDVLAGENDAPGVRHQSARELTDESRLAGAVRPDDGVRLAFAHVEVDPVARAQRAEALGQATDLKHHASKTSRRGRA